MNDYFSNRSGNGAMFLTMDEQEYASLLRENRYSEHYIESELELLRKIKVNFQKQQDAINPPPPPPELDEDGNVILDPLEAVLARSRKRRENYQYDRES